MCRIFKPYFFATLVITYFVTVVGMPVYMHYCGGEVEEISYLIKNNNCCGDETPVENGCCHDEGLVLSNKVDFTIKNFSHQITNTVTDLFYFLPDPWVPVKNVGSLRVPGVTDSSPPFQNSALAEIVVLRI